MSEFSKKIQEYVCSGHAILSVDTFEKDRAITELSNAAKAIERKTFIWSVAFGWVDENENPSSKVKDKAPVEDHLKAILDFEEDAIFILKDFGEYLKHETYPTSDIVISVLDKLKQIVASLNKTIIFVGPGLIIPKKLLHDITVLDFDLPNKEQIEERIRFATSDVIGMDGEKFEPDTTMMPHLIGACTGMTSQQIVDRVALALSRHKDLDENAVKTIGREKASVVKASGLLTYKEPPDGGLSTVGGYGAIKKHVSLDKPCFTEQAREFGIEFPKGIMLVGIPGCGKTLISIAIASELNLPLISLDVSDLMDKFVGESEAKMKESIKMLERLSPCVLQLDEIEKGFGGSSDNDGGTSKRMFGTFLKWLSDKKSPIYVVATANQVESLPPEFCRKGRFDEIFGLSLPDLVERAEIFKIHIENVNRNASDFDIQSLASATVGYTGADIEQIVKLGLKLAFFDEKELSHEYLIKAIDEIVPLSETESSRLEIIEQWCEKHAKSSKIKVKSTTGETKRKIKLN